MAVLKVFRQVGKVAESDFLAMEVLPLLWAYSLGPLLDLQQFQAFMTLIKSLSTRIEREQTRKLRELSNGNAAASLGGRGGAGRAGATNGMGVNGEEVDFESLVSGRNGLNGSADPMNEWDAPTSRPATSRTVSHQTAPTQPSWSTANNGWSTPSAAQNGSLRLPQATMRTITPDQSMSAFSTGTSNTAFAQPLQPSQGVMSHTSSLRPSPVTTPSTSINWSSAQTSSNAWAGSQHSIPAAQPYQVSNSISTTSFSIKPPPMNQPLQPQQLPLRNATISPLHQSQAGFQAPSQQPSQKQGLDKYESLI